MKIDCRATCIQVYNGNLGESVFWYYYRYELKGVFVGDKLNTSTAIAFWALCHNLSQIGA